MPDDIDLLDAPAGGGADGKAPTDADKGSVQGGSERGSSDDAAGKYQADASDDGKGASDDGDAAPKGRKGRGSKVAKKAEATDETGESGKAPAKAAASDDELGFGDEDEDGNPKGPATWPDDWREKLAGNNEKLGKRLARFASPEALLKSWQSLEQKLSSGEYKRAALPADASDEEKAEWRQANGIPDKPDGYQFPTIKGHEWSDDDKAIAGEFLAELHAANTPQPVAQAALGWYAKFQQQAVERRARQDRADIEAREDALRTEWGPKDFRPHIKLAKDTFQDDEFMPAELRTAIAGARTEDGRRLIYLPEFTRFLAEHGLERRGPAGLISGEQGARMGSRVDEIRRVLATDRDRYYSEGLDKELADLMEKMESGRSR